MDVFNDFRFRYRQGNAIVQMILINVAVFVLFATVGVVLFLFGQSAALDGVRKALMLPANLHSLLTQPWSLLSYMFLHEGLLHLIFNMLWLYWFGNLFQQYMGNSKAWQAYMLGGIFGGLLYILSFNLFPVFAEQVHYAYALGASAGVLSLVFAAATLLPEYEVFLFLVGPVKIKYIALVTVFLDLLSIPSGNAGGHIAHLGGALFGFLFVKLIYSNSSIPAFLDKVFGKAEKGSGRKESSRLKVHYRASGESSSKPAQEEIDSLLDKISRKGYSSLSKKEKEILFRAGKD